MNLLLTTGLLFLLSVAVVQTSFVEDEEPNGLEECDVKYEKVGCFKDPSGKARALSELIFNYRKNIQWEKGEWEKYLQRLACRCAKETGTKGYSHFGLQFYGECWSDAQAAERFGLYGKSDDCIGIEYKKCVDESNSECVGGGHLNYVYRVVGEEGGSGSEIEMPR